MDQEQCAVSIVLKIKITKIWYNFHLCPVAKTLYILFTYYYFTSASHELQDLDIWPTEVGILSSIHDLSLKIWLKVYNATVSDLYLYNVQFHYLKLQLPK